MFLSSVFVVSAWVYMYRSTGLPDVYSCPPVGGAKELDWIWQRGEHYSFIFFEKMALFTLGARSPAQLAENTFVF